MFFKERTTLSCFYKEVFCSSSLGKEGYVKKKKNLYSKLSLKKSITVIRSILLLIVPSLFFFFSYPICAFKPIKKLKPCTQETENPRSHWSKSYLCPGKSLSS